MFEQLVQSVLDQARLVAQAPIAFAAGVVILGAIVWSMLRWRYAKMIEHRNGIIALYKARLNGASPDQAKARMDSLEGQVVSLKNREWPKLAPAAVADFRPAELAEHKIKKSDDDDDAAPVVALVRNPDILKGLVAARRPGQVVVGFAAETGDAEGDALAHGRAKLATKGADLLVVNEVGGRGHPTGFEGAQNAAVVLGALAVGDAALRQFAPDESRDASVVDGRRCLQSEVEPALNFLAFAQVG